VFGLPNVEDRIDILIKSGRKMSHADMPIEEIASQTEGFSPADLCEIWSESGQCAASEERGIIQIEDFIEGFLRVSASRSKKEEYSS
jgi:transitional endoplasmic reticulum ATPase